MLHVQAKICQKMFFKEAKKAFLTCPMLDLKSISDTLFMMSVIIKIRKEIFEKLHFTLDSAIGCPLGSIFEVKGGKLSILDTTEDVDELLMAKDNSGKYRWNPIGSKL